MGKNKFIVYLVGIWVTFTIVIIYIISPLFSSNLGYYFKQREEPSKQKVEIKSEEPKVEKVSVPNKIIIPKINVDAPIVESPTITDKDVLRAMEDGVVRYPINSRPGEIGNVFITGHSSNYRWAKGNYKYVFANLNKLTNNDIITIYYGNKKYTYKVFEVIIVSPKEISVLKQTSDSIISIMTCDPPGTTWKRRVVKAKQIEPNSKYNVPGDQGVGSPVDKLIGN